MTHLDRQIRSLPLTDQLHALGHLRRLLPMMQPTHEACGCGSLNETDALACPSCGAAVCEALPPLTILGEHSRALQHAYLRAIQATPEEANELARAWLWALDHEEAR